MNPQTLRLTVQCCSFQCGLHCGCVYVMDLWW